MPSYKIHDGKWKMETAYEQGHRHALKGNPHSPQTLTSKFQQDNVNDYQEGYEAGHRERLTKLLLK